ncbi:unnamed protein product, partial [Brenthis ino]
MKYSVFALFLVIAGAFAFPQVEDPQRDARIITGRIRRAIEELQEKIIDAGMDPLVVPRLDLEYRPVPFFLEVRGFLENFEFTGASNIAIHNLDYSALFNRLRFDISLPELSFVVGDSGVTAIVLGNRYNGQLHGSLSISGIRIDGEVRVNIGIISGISIRSLTLDFTLGGIQSDLNVVFMGEDFSDIVNKVLGEDIPAAVAENRRRERRGRGGGERRRGEEERRGGGESVYKFSKM